LLAATAYAQEADPAYSHKIKIQGAKTPNLQFTVFTGAPAGFDPETASVEALASYGYPRHPDFNDTKAYDRWLKQVSTKFIDAQLEVVPGKYHPPNQRLKTLSTVRNTTNSTSGKQSAVDQTLGRAP
jgi:hypothetical protein